MMTNTERPEAWGLYTAGSGELAVAHCSTVELAERYGTPLHVVHERFLEDRAGSFRTCVESAYPGKVSVHYAFKCNSVPGVIDIIRRASLKAEVTTPFELDLATSLGFGGSEIVVNGPCKTRHFLKACLRANVRLIVVDSLDELRDLAAIASGLGVSADILLRVNPDYIPRGMNRGSATASRTGCAFGLDFKGGEVGAALGLLRTTGHVRCRGYHMHIGTGIRDPRDYEGALGILPSLIGLSRTAGQRIEILDIGGGFASATTRELTGFELLANQALGWFPSRGPASSEISLAEFANVIAGSVTRCFSPGELPELICEPGRSIASAGQFLLLTIQRIKERPGAGTWLIADGGLGTVTLPTYYEYHEVFLCNDMHRPRTEKVTIVGPACFAGDVVYRNKRMPRVHPGEVIAIMDSGAYFTALESSFGFSRPAIISVDGCVSRILRRRESFDEMTHRDVLLSSSEERSVNHEIRAHTEWQSSLS